MVEPINTHLVDMNGSSTGWTALAVAAALFVVGSLAVLLPSIVSEAAGSLQRSEAASVGDFIKNYIH